MRIIYILIYLLVSLNIYGQSVGLIINSVTGNVVNVTPTITAGSSPIYLANITLRFTVTNNSYPIYTIESSSSDTLLSSNNSIVTVSLLSEINNLNQLVFDYQPLSPNNQATFNTYVGLVQSNTTAALGDFDVTFSGPPNGTIGCGVQSVWGFDNSSPWNQSQILVSCSTNLSILPITLTVFSATKHTERASKLDWTTSSEINSDYFGIERSRDGNDWFEIARVKAAGNSSESKTYDFIDDRLSLSRSRDQIFYYRLRMTDLDGSHKYSDIKGVNFSASLAAGDITVYPNPTTQMVHIDVAGLNLTVGETRLRICDMYGRVVLDKHIKGGGLEPVDVWQYPSGVYNVSVTQGEISHQKQFIKMD